MSQAHETGLQARLTRQALGSDLEVRPQGQASRQGLKVRPVVRAKFNHMHADKMTKAAIIALLAILSIWSLHAQTDADIISQRGSVTFMPLFQGWTLNGGVSFSETSTLISAYAPLNRFLGISLRGSYASISGGVPTLRDLSDTQLWVNCLLESANLIFRAGVNFPSGRKELNTNEFTTSLLASEPAFDLAVPNFGQGWNLSPGVIWALKLNDKVVVGLGGTYQYKGPYKPLAGLGEYDPGDEIVLTGGVDVRMNEASTISADLIFTNYQSDRIGGTEVFAAGNRWVTNLQFRTSIGRNELSVLGRYRTRAKNDVAIAGVMVSEHEKITPDQIELLAQFQMHPSDRIGLRILARGEFFQSTAAPLSGISLYGLGIAPEFMVSPTLKIPVQLALVGGRQNDGKFLGSFEGGIGVEFGF